MNINLQDINYIDYGIIGLISFSVLMGIVRGFILEAISLATWIIALWLGYLYCGSVGNYFTGISTTYVRSTIAFILIVLSTLIIGGIIAHLISKIIRLTGFGVTDRIMGTFFGFVRGTALVAFGILILQPSPLGKMPMWQSSDMVPKFQPISLWMQEVIPGVMPEDLLNIMKKFF